MGLGEIVADGLDGKVRVDVFVYMKDERQWRGISWEGRTDVDTRIHAARFHCIYTPGFV